MGISEKLDKVLEQTNEIKVDLGKFEERQAQMRIELDSQAKEIKSLVAIKNKGIGISILAGTGIGAFLNYLFRHL
jgi:hypothetical protein